MEFRDLKRQYEALKDKIDAALTGVAASRRVYQRAEVRELESELAEYVGVRHSVSCARHRRARHGAFGVGRDGRRRRIVPISPFSRQPRPLPAPELRVFVDVLPDTFNMDAESLEDAVRRLRQPVV